MSYQPAGEEIWKKYPSGKKTDVVHMTARKRMPKPLESPIIPRQCNPNMSFYSMGDLEEYLWPLRWSALVRAVRPEQSCRELQMTKQKVNASIFASCCGYNGESSFCLFVVCIVKHAIDGPWLDE